MKGTVVLGAAAATGLAWGWFEAGWVRFRVRDVPVRGLPEELVGLRIAHLSDFHFGAPSRGTRAVRRAADWAAERRADVVVITGDLLSHPRGYPQLRPVLERLAGAYAVLGNHDFGVARDPLAKRAVPFDARPVVLLSDEAVTLELRGRRVQIVGVDPKTYGLGRARPERLADESADLRILLCHYPRVVDKIEPAVFDLVLAGHLHDGQIAIPYGRAKLRLADVHHPYPSGVFSRPGGTLHVSPGLGTTFLPFRFFARPEATELVLQRA